MKIRALLYGVVLAYLGLMGTAFAEGKGCVVHYDRTVLCAGQKVKSYSKCGGQNTCNQFIKSADSMQQCWQKALDACVNNRFDITNYQVITAHYNDQLLEGGYDSNGKPVMGGANFCTADRLDLHQCQ